jgi:rubrerythrin
MPNMDRTASEWGEILSKQDLAQRNRIHDLVQTAIVALTEVASITSARPAPAQEAPVDPKTFEEFAAAEGWSLEEQVAILSEYIANQESDEAFIDFLQEQRKAKWHGPVDDDGNPIKFRNHYRCGRCDTTWTDDYSCQVEDDCPVCGSRHWTPVKSEDLDEEGNVVT